MKKLLLLALLFVSGTVMAQNVGIGTANPDESAILDLRSSSKGFLLPRLTEKQKSLIPQPAEGLMIYQTDTNQGVYLYQGGKWNNMGSANVTTSTISGPTANAVGPYTANYLLAGDGTSSPMSTSIYVNPSNGYLGIGISNPLNMIHTKSTAGGLIKIEGTDASSTVYYTAKNTTGDEFQVGIASTNYSNPNYPGIPARGGYFYSARNLGLIADNNSSIILQTGGLERFRFSSSGNFGIGTSNPENMIHAKNSAGGLIKIEGTDAASTVYYTAKNTTGDEFQVGIASTNYVNTRYPGIPARGGYFYSSRNLGLIADNNSSIVLQTGGMERFRFSSSGNLGVGTTSPENMIHAKNSAGGLIKIEGTDAASTVYYTAKNTTGDEFQVGIASTNFSNSNYPGIPARGGYFYSSRDLGLIADNNSSIIFQTGGAEKFKFSSIGNLGIGVTLPTEKLDVSGSIKQSAVTSSVLKADGTGKLVAATAGTDFVAAGTNSVGTIAKFSASGTVANSALTEAAITNGTGVKLDSKSAGYLAVGDFGAGTPMSIPTGYRLVVQDGIITEKVKVAVRNQTDWADYVFEPNYSLMPLNEVETFVKENKHLPNVPSADQMVEQGVEVGKTSKMFMEKIEELTLYLIGLKKEVEALKAENAKLKK